MRQRKNPALVAAKATAAAREGATVELQGAHLDLRRACIHTEITHYWKAFKKKDGGKKVCRYPWPHIHQYADQLNLRLTACML